MSTNPDQRESDMPHTPPDNGRYQADDAPPQPMEPQAATTPAEGQSGTTPPPGDASSPNARQAVPEYIKVVQGLSDHQREPGVATNFTTMMSKNMRLKMRGIVSTLLETLLPIVFILGLVGIWSAVDDGNQPETHYANGTLNNVSDYNRTIDDVVCVHPTGPAIDGLNTCTSAELAGFLQCIRDAPMVNPIARGLCTKIPAEQALFSFLNNRAPRYVPTIDEMIVYQWIANATVTYRMEDNGYQEPISALANGGYLHFAPATPEVAAFVQHLNTTTRLFRHVYGQTFASEQQAVDFTISNDMADLNWGVVYIPRLDSTDGLNLHIRMNRSGVPWTNRIVRVGNGMGEFATANYLASGFLTIQDAVSRYYISQIQGQPEPPRTVHLPMGYNSYDTSSFLEIIGILAPLFLVFGYLYPVSQLVKRIVEEKEQRVREAMMIMGLTTAPFYASWVVTYFVFQIATALIAAILLKTTMFPKSDFFIMFLLYLLFGFSNVTLSSVVSSFFSKSRMAAIVSPVLFFIFAIPSFALPQDTPAGVLVILSFMSPTAFAQGMGALVDHELSGGLTWRNINKSFDGYPMSIALFMLALDTVLYMLFTLYLDAVIPSEWGTRAHPCFCFIAPYQWWKRRQSQDKEDGEDNDGRDPTGTFEPEPEGVAPSVELRGVRKEFTLPDGSNFTAVRDLTFNMYENQVFALLGHNGAGKTTAMNCMTGMLEMDGGDCRFHGHSVRHNLADVRREIGYCPQHNILWPELTAREHLDFFARLKGLPADARGPAVEAMLQAVDLLDKGDSLPGELSGGQKRKLSVGIAFVGGSKVVFLDEPTAGMDVAARRHTWELIKHMTKGRTIVLTTHFMDEADLLGDTVAIMAKGRLKCSGSSVFLKSRLGVGYTLSVACQPNVNEGVIEAVKGFVPELDVLSNGAGEVALRLPMGSVPRFPDLLSHLEENGESLGVRGHGISVTTLEEIFLKIGHDEETVADAITPHVKVDGSAFSDPPPQQTEVHIDDDKKLSWNDEIANSQGTVGGQAAATIVKRFHYARRDTRTIVMQIVLPVICITFAMLLTLLEFPDAPAVEMADYGLYEGDADLVFTNCPSDWASFTPPGALPVDVTPAMASGDFSRHLVEKWYEHRDNRIGAHVCSDTTFYPISPVNRAPLANASAPGEPVSVFLTNNSIYVHAGPQSLFELQATWIRRNAASRALPVKVTTHPLPLSAYEEAFVEGIVSVFVAIFVLIPFTFIPSTFVSFIVKERESRALQLQQASGLKYIVYWWSNFAFDMISFTITALLAITIFAIFGRDEYTGSGEVFGAVFVLMLLYGVAGVAGAYVVSFFFESHSTAQNITMLGNFICGFMLVLLAYILSAIESTKDAGEALQWIFRIVPSYCLGEGILNLANRQLAESFGDKKGAFELDVTGYPMIYMAIEFPLFMLAVMYMDSPTRREQAHRVLGETDTTKDRDWPKDEDEDVAEERRAVESGEREDDHILVRNLRKYYPSSDVLAVRDLSFGVHRGEVFGFLGTNGAGKSTSISILCGEHMPTSGRASIAGLDVVEQAGQTRSLIGYCPQFDALHDLLTVEEHLDLYSRLRGLSGALKTDVTERLIHVCELQEHRGKIASSLSGGNKRKLSVAISLLGAPQVVFLDEPSAGMDPMARRTMWGLIQQVAAHCSVVLTTHHLEEIEALASRTGIMVKGEMKCIGSLQHLKTKFGSGFEMSVRVLHEEQVEGLKQFVTVSIPEAELQEENGTKLTYQLPQSTKLSSVFATVQGSRDELGVSDYSVSQTSLESVFLRISADAEAEADDAGKQ